jgi:CTP synthase (UTP-ammonia lyase)
VIWPVVCAVPNRNEGAPKLSGASHIRIKPASLLHTIYGREEANEEYFCNYEVNPEYEPPLAGAGLNMTAWGPKGEVRAAELPLHRFFVATLFQPQLSSTAEKPHPLIMAYLEAATRFREARSVVKVAHQD